MLIVGFWYTFNLVNRGVQIQSKDYESNKINHAEKRMRFGNMAVIFALFLLFTVVNTSDKHYQNYDISNSNPANLTKNQKLKDFRQSPYRSTFQGNNLFFENKKLKWIQSELSNKNIVFIINTYTLLNLNCKRLIIIWTLLSFTFNGLFRFWVQPIL